MINITPIVNAILVLVSAVLTIVVVPWIKTKVAAETLTKTTEIIRIAVTAAEQIAIANGWNGEAKKEYVKAYLVTKGIVIDSTIDNTIEAMVYELHNALVE